MLNLQASAQNLTTRLQSPPISIQRHRNDSSQRKTDENCADYEIQAPAKSGTESGGRSTSGNMDAGCPHRLGADELAEVNDQSRILPEVDPHGNSRWHLDTCKAPEIAINGHDVSCMSCNRAPNLKLMVSKRGLQPTIQSVPKDEPDGKHNLWWPPGVPYINKTSSLAGSGVGKASGKEDDRETPDISQIPQRERNPVYESELASNEFHLLCLTAEQSDDTPMCFTLETHGDDRYPEYETVSYTWGGEDGDHSLCKPTYVGPFWDVLLQTKNCWNMLKFLRPQRGHRLVWVDAICINQQNRTERNTQVTKMGPESVRQWRRPEAVSSITQALGSGSSPKEPHQLTYQKQLVREVIVIGCLVVLVESAKVAAGAGTLTTRFVI